MSKRNTVVDFAKYIAALMVVAVHTKLFSDVNDTLYFTVVHIICRVAVPFFAVSTGYFLSRRLGFDGVMVKSKENRQVLWRQWKKLVLLYGVWTVLYLFFSIPKWIRIDWFSIHSFIDYAVAAVKGGSYYHLWYLLSAIYALPLFYVLLRKVPARWFPGVIALLWAAKVLLYTYQGFLPEQIQQMFAHFSDLNGLLCVLPLLMLGALISREKPKPAGFYGKGLAVSSLLLTAEAFGLKAAGREAVSYIVFTLPTTYFLFNLLLRGNFSVNGKRSGKLGAVSIYVYCVHPMVLELMQPLIENSVLHFLLVAVGSTVIGFAILFAQEILCGRGRAVYDRF